jgi:hypothetical protein
MAEIAGQNAVSSRLPDDLLLDHPLKTRSASDGASSGAASTSAGLAVIANGGSLWMPVSVINRRTFLPSRTYGL